MGGDNFRKGEGKVDPNNKFLKLREEFYEQERKKETALWESINNQLSSIDRLFGFMHLNASSPLVNRSDFHSAVEGICSQLRRAGFECVPHINQGHSIKSHKINISWDWRKLYDRAQSGENLDFSFEFGGHIERCITIRSALLDGLEDQLSQQIVSTIQRAKKDNFLTSRGEVKTNVSNLKRLHYRPPGYYWSDKDGFVSKVVIGKGKNTISHIEITHSPSGMSWPIFFDGFNPDDVQLCGNKLIFLHDESVYFEDLQQRIEYGVPISLKAISLELSILNRVINLRKFNSSPYGNGFLIRYNSNFTQYFSGPRNSPIEVAYGQNVFNPDGSLLIGDSKNPYAGWRIGSQGNVRKTNVSISSDILPVYSNDGTLFSKRPRSPPNTLMIDDSNTLLIVNGNGIAGNFVIQSLKRIENRGGVYVEGQWTDSQRNRSSICGTLNKSGLIDLHGVMGPNVGDSVFYYEGDDEIEEILTKVRKELEVAGIEIDALHDGNIEINWSW